MNDIPKPQLPKIVIELTVDGQIHVTGAIHDRILAMGMLECAKIAINSSIPNTHGPQLVPLPIPKGINLKGN